MFILNFLALDFLMRLALKIRNGSRVYRTKTLMWHNLTRNLVDLFLSDRRNKYRFETTPSGDRVIKKTADGKNVMLSFDSR